VRPPGSAPELRRGVDEFDLAGPIRLPVPDVTYALERGPSAGDDLLRYGSDVTYPFVCDWDDEVPDITDPRTLTIPSLINQDLEEPDEFASDPPDPAPGSARAGYPFPVQRGTFRPRPKPVLPPAAPGQPAGARPGVNGHLRQLRRRRQKRMLAIGLAARALEWPDLPPPALEPGPSVQAVTPPAGPAPNPQPAPAEPKTPTVQPGMRLPLMPHLGIKLPPMPQPKPAPPPAPPPSPPPEDPPPTPPASPGME